MATTTTELPETTPASTDDDFEIDHLYCCNEDKALCGLDLTGVPEAPTISDHPVCPLCMLVEERGRCPQCGE